jgi:hypothetical protein
MILFWFEILSWDIRYSKRYLSARILLRTRMQMLKHNSVVKFGSFKLRIFEGKEKIDIIQVRKFYVIYNMKLYQFR